MKVPVSGHSALGHATQQVNDIHRLDERISRMRMPVLEGAALAETYDALKKRWSDQQPLAQKDVVAWLKERKGSNGISLGKDSLTTLDAISALRAEANADAHVPELFRGTLDRACTREVAISGIVAMFRARMLQPPDVPEPW